MGHTVLYVDHSVTTKDDQPVRLSIGGGFVEDTFVDIDRSFVFAVAAKMIGPLVKIRDFFIRLTGDGLHSSANTRISKN